MNIAYGTLAHWFANEPYYKLIKSLDFQEHVFYSNSFDDGQHVSYIKASNSHTSFHMTLTTQTTHEVGC